MKKISIKTLASVLILSCTALFAESSQEEMVDFNSSPLTTEALLLLEEIEQEINQMQNAPHKEKPITGTTEITSLHESLADHILASFPQDNMIKLDDGSEWSFDRNDIPQVHGKWEEGHTLLLYPSNDKDKPYLFYNEDLGTYLRINPYIGPKKEGPKTNWILGFDPNLGHVFLVNGLGDRTSWAIDPTYMPIFREWDTKQTVIIASFAKTWYESALSWFFPSYDFVLLNVNKVHNIPAKPL